MLIIILAKPALTLSLLASLLLYTASAQAKDTADLNIISSADIGSNQINSFIVVPSKLSIPQGIKQSSPQDILSLQAPFVIELKQPAT